MTLTLTLYSGSRFAESTPFLPSTPDAEVGCDVQAVVALVVRHYHIECAGQSYGRRE